ncbi:hypothetical protein OH491_17535 [Termitidicoccus mucosus]|uniref:Uncharacterized protein n=1 Tax=Termitidicoccus mucosus TaxID=1184151 RepID=A0A178IIY3_9BACT|nr:hypothetical protein AW736_11065 [Opitutaceae bacterium TSB47]
MGLFTRFNRYESPRRLAIDAWQCRLHPPAEPISEAEQEECRFNEYKKGYVTGDAFLANGVLYIGYAESVETSVTSNGGGSTVTIGAGSIKASTLIAKGEMTEAEARAIAAACLEE